MPAAELHELSQAGAEEGAGGRRSVLIPRRQGSYSSSSSKSSTWAEARSRACRRSYPGFPTTAARGRRFGEGFFRPEKTLPGRVR